MTQEMLIMAAILVAVILLTLSVSCRVTVNVRVTKSSLYTVKQGRKEISQVISRWGRFRMADHSGLRIPFYETIADRL